MLVVRLIVIARRRPRSMGVHRTPAIINDTKQAYTRKHSHSPLSLSLSQSAGRIDSAPDNCTYTYTQNCCSQNASGHHTVTESFRVSMRRLCERRRRRLLCAHAQVDPQTHTRTHTQVRTAHASEVKVQGQFSARWRMHSTGNETTRRHRSCLSLYLSANAIHVVAPLKSCAKPRARRIAMVLETFYVAKRAARWPGCAGLGGMARSVAKLFYENCQERCRRARTLHTHTHTARHSGKPSIYRCV